MLRNLGYFGLSSLIVGSGGFGYFWWKARSNRLRLEREANDTESRDTTRPQYDYFGINWGAKADIMVKVVLRKIMDQLQTGDVFYFKIDCSESMDLTSK